MLCEIMSPTKGDYVAIYETDNGEIALAKPEIRVVSQDRNGSETEA